MGCFRFRTRGFIPSFPPQEQRAKRHNTDSETCARRSPNDHVIFVDDASQGAVFNGEAVADDDAGSAFEAVGGKKNTTYKNSVSVFKFLFDWKQNVTLSRERERERLEQGHFVDHNEGQSSWP